MTADGAVWPRGPVINEDVLRRVAAVGGTCHAVRAALCAAVTAVAVTVAPAARPPAAASVAAGDGRPPRLVDVARFLSTLPTLRSLYVAVGGWSGRGVDVVAVAGTGGLVADALAAVPAGRLTAFGWADAALTASELRLLRCHPLPGLHVGPVVHDTARPPPTALDTDGDGHARASPPFSLGPPPVTTVALDGDGSGGGYSPPSPPSDDVDVARTALADAAAAAVAAAAPTLATLTWSAAVAAAVCLADADKTAYVVQTLPAALPALRRLTHAGAALGPAAADGLAARCDVLTSLVLVACVDGDGGGGGGGGGGGDGWAAARPLPRLAVADFGGCAWPTAAVIGWALLSPQLVRLDVAGAPSSEVMAVAAAIGDQAGAGGGGAPATVVLGAPLPASAVDRLVRTGAFGRVRALSVAVEGPLGGGLLAGLAAIPCLTHLALTSARPRAARQRWRPPDGCASAAATPAVTAADADRRSPAAGAAAATLTATAAVGLSCRSLVALTLDGVVFGDAVAAAAVVAAAATSAGRWTTLALVGCGRDPAVAAVFAAAAACGGVGAPPRRSAGVGGGSRPL